MNQNATMYEAISDFIKQLAENIIICGHTCEFSFMCFFF